MKFLISLLVLMFFNSCSLSKDSQYWTEDDVKKKNNQKKLSKVLKKADDITSMTPFEYEIYIDDFTKKSKYPDISKWKI